MSQVCFIDILFENPVPESNNTNVIDSDSDNAGPSMFIRLSIRSTAKTYSTCTFGCKSVDERDLCCIKKDIRTEILIHYRVIIHNDFR